VQNAANNYDKKHQTCVCIVSSLNNVMSLVVLLGHPFSRVPNVVGYEYDSSIFALRIGSEENRGKKCQKLR